MGETVGFAVVGAIVGSDVVGAIVGGFVGSIVGNFVGAGVNLVGSAVGSEVVDTTGSGVLTKFMKSGFVEIFSAGDTEGAVVGAEVVLPF